MQKDSNIAEAECKWKQLFAAWLVSPSDFVQQPFASESTLCLLEGRMTTYSTHDRDASLIEAIHFRVLVIPLSPLMCKLHPEQDGVSAPKFE